MIAALAPLLFAVMGAISALVIAVSLIGARKAWRALMDERPDHDL